MSTYTLYCCGLNSCILMLMLSPPISALLSLQMWINHLTWPHSKHRCHTLHGESYKQLLQVVQCCLVCWWCLDWLSWFILAVIAGSYHLVRCLVALAKCKRPQNSLQFCCSYNRVLLKDFTENDKRQASLSLMFSQISI